MMIVGLGLGIPHHVWYLFLDRLLPGTALLTVAKKILLDQATFSPFASFFFFMSSGLLEGQSVRQSWQELKTKFPMVYKVQTDMSTDISFSLSNSCHLIFYVRFRCIQRTV